MKSIALYCPSAKMDYAQEPIFCTYFTEKLINRENPQCRIPAAGDSDVRKRAGSLLTVVCAVALS